MLGPAALVPGLFVSACTAILTHAGLSSFAQGTARSTSNDPMRKRRQHLAAGEVQEDSAEEDDNGSDDGDNGDADAQHTEPTSRQVRLGAYANGMVIGCPLRPEGNCVVTELRWAHATRLQRLADTCLLYV